MAFIIIYLTGVLSGMETPVGACAVEPAVEPAVVPEVTEEPEIIPFVRSGRYRIMYRLCELEKKLTTFSRPDLRCVSINSNTLAPGRSECDSKIFNILFF